MLSNEAVLTQARAALARVPYQGHALHPTIHLRLSDGALILEGDVADIVDKTRAVAQLRRVEGVSTVIDHLRISNGGPAVGDGDLRAAVCERLLNAIDFRNCKLCAKVKGQLEAVREAVGERSGWIEVAVHDGTVMLSGQVISLSHMRLAGVLAWWSRGCRCVVNDIVVAPAEADSDDELNEAIRLVLETDPFVDHARIRVRTEGRVVTLDGYASSDGARRQVERDVWYVLGVENVINHIALSS
ncbi:MAG: BON domain-containing protein [Cupriavidus sp.]|jgi:osmotically-inducible protein OsmY|uniref:BON domain-containing protein n=1 Tax=Cupriavidus pauculus TaxID=82633 RepID=UPI0007805EB2|nr:BON domain-containing protein [Cupriavidus pauculus]MBU67591.1 BON domain-containing protein [Cupriavidus sp.]KAB0601385.1 BON domain-containing protein [Cupriavidus pauculus]MBY4732734.1 BON domain-containing protein [Cupriavidus pauculus]MCM3606019.1 BON domain-containing protein [Cupriavidus pauculus]UAL02942.1 BON domain-containing protein [Cupriavidus pauculus]